MRVPSYVVRQELERNKTVEGILSLVNHFHPAATELFDDAVVRDGLADQFGRDSDPWEAILGGGVPN